MPRRILPLIFVLSLFFPSWDAYAQLDKGLLAGWNRTDWDFPDHDFFEPKNGFCAGLFVGGNVGGNFGGRLEILYSRKGAKVPTTATDENGQLLGEWTTFYNLDYLEIPLLATFTIPTGGSAKPVLFLGPALGIELSAKAKNEYTSGVENPNLPTEDLDVTRSPDFSLVLGAGVDLATGPKLVMLQVRYVAGLKEIFYSGKNRTFSVMAGFGI